MKKFVIFSDKELMDMLNDKVVTGDENGDKLYMSSRCFNQELYKKTDKEREENDRK